MMLSRAAWVSVLVLTAACGAVRLDENLCPIGQSPARTTVLLLDTSDPLTPKQREVFARLVKELQGAGGPSDFRIAPGEALVVYELSRHLAGVEPLMLVCNPGDSPEGWTWQRELTEGKMIALRRWQQFRERVEPLFSRADTVAQPSSPIIEFLGVVVPRHVRSSRMDSDMRTHLIVYSDLLQHSDTLSHYGPFPDAETVGKAAGYRHLKTDLAGVDVSLYRLERGRDARWQTTEHYYWWTKLVQSLGGQVIWQESV